MQKLLAVGALALVPRPRRARVRNRADARHPGKRCRIGSARLLYLIALAAVWSSCDEMTTAARRPLLRTQL